MPAQNTGLSTSALNRPGVPLNTRTLVTLLGGHPLECDEHIVGSTGQKATSAVIPVKPTGSLVRAIAVSVCSEYRKQAGPFALHIVWQ